MLNHHLKNTYFDLCKQLSSSFSKHHRAFCYKFSLSSFSLAFFELCLSLSAQEKSPSGLLQGTSRTVIRDKQGLERIRSGIREGDTQRNFQRRCLRSFSRHMNRIPGGAFLSPSARCLGVISACMSSSGTEVDTEVTPHLGRSAFTRLSVCLYYFTSPLSSHLEEVDPASPCWPQTPSSSEAGLMRNMRGEIFIQTPSNTSGIQTACLRPLAMRPCHGVEGSLISCSEVRVFAISTVGDPQSGLLHHPHHTEGPCL